MAGDELTERQQQVMDCVRTTLAARGYPPTMREIGAAVGLRSASSVHHQLDALQAKGLLRRDPLRSRTLEVLTSGQVGAGGLAAVAPRAGSASPAGALGESGARE